MDKKLFSLISIRTLEKITDSIGLSLLLFRYFGSFYSTQVRVL